EDGIRDFHVTGVQTCALPISTLFSLLDDAQSQSVQLAVIATMGKFSDGSVATRLIEQFPAMTPRVRNETLTVLLARPDRVLKLRSEERRVGNAGRSRWWTE